MGSTLALALLLMSDVDMKWNAPPACPDEASVRAQVADFLRSSTVNADSVRARVTVEEGEAGWAADLELTVGELTEHRILQDRSCEVVAAASAFVVAVAIDPELLTSEAEPADLVPDAVDPMPAKRVPRVKPDPPVDPPSNIPQEPAPTQPTPRRAISGALRVGPALDVGASAGPGVGPQLTGSLRIGPWRIEIPVVALFGLRTSVSAGSVQTTLWAAGVRGCRELGRAALRVPLCVGAQGGRFRARARGFDEVGTAAAPWFAPTADVGLHWAFVSRFAVQGGAGAVLPVLRPRFEVDNVGLVHRAGPVAFRAELGIEVRFP